jgi:hypothetical protein
MEAGLIDLTQDAATEGFFTAPTMLVICARKCFISADSKGEAFSMTDGPSIPPPPPSAGGSSFITRAINMLTKPQAEWNAVAAEQTSVGKMIAGYAVILSLIAPIFALLNILISPGGTMIFHLPMALIFTLLFSYLLALVPPILLGYIVDALTPNLGGQKNSLNAMKLTIYAATAYWVAAVAIIISPYLWLVLGLGYAGFLLWFGTPVLMRTVGDKTAIFVGATVGIWLVLFFVLNLIFEKVLSSILYSALTSGLGARYGM